MIIEKTASAIQNNVLSGLVGFTSTPTISLTQLEDDTVDEYLQVIKEYSMKNLIPRKDLLYSINCIQVDCMSLDKCCISSNHSKPIAHFEIPQLVNDFGETAIEFIGSTDKMVYFKPYTSKIFKYHKSKLRGANKPYVYIETTANSNNMYDGWIFNAPLLKQLTVIAIFKDLRQVDEYSCCNTDSENLSFIFTEVKKRLTEKYLRYYKLGTQQPQPNNQIPH